MLNMNVEYVKEDGSFPLFFKKIAGKKVAVVYDVNTAPYALDLIAKIEKVGADVCKVAFPDEELVPDEHVYNTLKAEAEKFGAEYVLAVGSGSLNDVAKFVGSTLSVPSGVLATAASMDGYCSKGAAVMENGFKVTESVNAPEDILIDLSVVGTAPKLMTAAGFGDIIGKYTCLTDWKLSNVLNGEPINEEAFSLMEKARKECIDAFDGLASGDADAVGKLMNALITAGISMAICGNSRPASGSEHHQSHFLEMDFVRRGEKIPPHGVKVGIGTLVSIELYNYIRDHKIRFDGADNVYKLADELPSVDSVKAMLEKLGCPTRFSAIGVRRETMEEMIEKAYTVRDRFTVLTLIHNLGLTDKIKPVIMGKYF